MFDLLNGLGDMQSQMEESKKKLSTIIVSGTAGDGAVKVTATADQKITAINIDPKLLTTECAEELEDLLMVAINRSLDAAAKMAASEMEKVAGNMLPPGFNLPGLF